MIYRISVIVPCYNSSKTITSTLLSVVNQTYKPFEIIVINDGSTDNTTELVRMFKEQFKCQLISIYEQENSGPAQARNLGIKYASGDLIAFIDSDDLWLESKLQKQIDVFIELEDRVDFVATNDFLLSKSDYRKVNFSNLLWRNPILTSSVLGRKTIFDVMNFAPHKKYSEDYQLWGQIVNYYTVVIMREKLVVYQKFESGLSSKLWKMQLGELNTYCNWVHLNYVSKIKFVFVVIFSLVRFCRRLLCKYIKSI